MDTWLSWTIFIALCGVVYWYYGQQAQHGRPRGRSLQRAPATNTAAIDPSSWLDTNAKSKPAPKPAKAKAPRKPVKKTVQEVDQKVAAPVSGASSTADADDDLSPIASPALGATISAKAPSGRDVSDMLEPHGAAPAVLKINASEKPARSTKPQQQQQRTESAQETKKQRQNRKKVEEAKAQREADEKERKALLEKQRRTAREARGEPAKNGLQPSQAPNSNAWSTVRSSGASAPSANNGQLLDTFDPEVVSTTSSSEAATNGTAPTPDSVSNSGHWSNLPPEEEQLRMALEDSAWTPVASKAKKQRKNKNAELTEEGSDSGATQAPAVKTAAKPVENIVPSARFAVLSEPVPHVSHPDDSDWPVV